MTRTSVWTGESALALASGAAPTAPVSPHPIPSAAAGLPEELAVALAADPAAERLFAADRAEHRKAYITWVKGSPYSVGRVHRAAEVVRNLHIHNGARQRELNRRDR